MWFICCFFVLFYVFVSLLYSMLFCCWLYLHGGNVVHCVPSSMFSFRHGIFIFLTGGYPHWMLEPLEAVHCPGTLGPEGAMGQKLPTEDPLLAYVSLIWKRQLNRVAAFIPKRLIPSVSRRCLDSSAWYFISNEVLVWSVLTRSGVGGWLLASLLGPIVGGACCTLFPYEDKQVPKWGLLGEVLVLALAFVNVVFCLFLFGFTCFEWWFRLIIIAWAINNMAYGVCAFHTNPQNARQYR